MGLQKGGPQWPGAPQGHTASPCSAATGHTGSRCPAQGRRALRAPACPPGPHGWRGRVGRSPLRGPGGHRPLAFQALGLLAGGPKCRGGAGARVARGPALGLKAFGPVAGGGRKYPSVQSQIARSASLLRVWPQTGQGPGWRQRTTACFALLGRAGPEGRAIPPGVSPGKSFLKFQSALDPKVERYLSVRWCIGSDDVSIRARPEGRAIRWAWRCSAWTTTRFNPRSIRRSSDRTQTEQNSHIKKVSIRARSEDRAIARPTMDELRAELFQSALDPKIER